MSWKNTGHIWLVEKQMENYKTFPMVDSCFLVTCSKFFKICKNGKNKKKKSLNFFSQVQFHMNTIGGSQNQFGSRSDLISAIDRFHGEISENPGH